MTIPYIDTDVIIRLVTGDDPTKQRAARALFKRIEDSTACPGSHRKSRPKRVMSQSMISESWGVRS